ncbi:MAG: UvrD-helicase domain-containing protein [Nitrospirota bacterium]
MDHSPPDIARFIHLSASAGSGKTRALTQRYVALLQELTARGLNIDQAVAITFTDKAAAEIKERVLGVLPEDLLKKIIRGRQDLRISTIHSFCMNLLKRYPLEAGLPPDFGILDERDKSYKIRQAVEAALEDLDRDRGVMGPLREYSANELVGLVEFLLSLRTRLKRMEIDTGGQTGLLEALRRGMELDRADQELKELLAGPEWKTLFRRVADLARELGEDPVDNRVAEHCALGETCDAGAAYRAANALLNLYSTKEGTPRKRPWIAKGKRSAKAFDAYKEAFEAAQELFFRFRDLSNRVRAGSEAESLIRLYLHAEELYLDIKLREGLLDFDDLEIFAYRLLKGQESPDILYWLDRKVLHYLVDEFQDTSDIQWAVLDRLTEEIFSGQGAVKPMQPSLFVVGDKKQSIYRFREANYRLIDDVRRAMEALPAGSQEIRTLDRNYRSVPEVIGAVNAVFSALWQQEYQPLEAARTAHHGTVTLIELPPPAGPEDLTEAAVLAQEIGRLIRAGTTVHIKNGDVWSERKAGYSDCAILIQSRTRLKDYEAALLAEDIPFRVVGGIGFYEEDEVQAIISVLFYLWNNDDRMALAAGLKSALFGLTDRDLESLLSRGGSLAESLRRLVPDIAATLERWQDLAGVVPLAPLLHRIISDTGAYVRFGRRRAQAVFNLDKLLDTAREFDRRGYTTLQDFVEWVKSMRESEQREATADMNLPGDQGAVSIMTVHKAKGLEFPVVFLPGMNQQTRSLKSGPSVIVEAGKKGQMRMAGPDRENPVYEDLWEREQAELRQEHQRLLYVAMTRACDHLVMTGTLAGGRRSGQQPGASPNTWLQYLHTAIPGLDRQAGDTVGPIISFTYPDWRPQTLQEDRQAAPGPGTGEQEQSMVIDPATVIGNISPLPHSKSAPWKKATDFLQPLRQQTAEQDLPRETECLSPLTRGSFFHRCLELASTTGSFDLAQVTHEFPEVLALTADERVRFLTEADEVLRAVIGNDELAWIFKQQPGAYSELPFLYRRENEIISGVIDRLIVKENTGYVIDYKSISVTNDEVLQSWIDHYRPQIRIYCEAAREMFRLEHVEGYLLFLDSARLAMIVKM